MTLRQFLPIALYGLLSIAATDSSAQSPIKPPSITEHFRLQQHGGGLGVQIDESVVVLAEEDMSEGQQWVIERQRRDRNWCGKKSDEGKCLESDETVHDWATSMNCPELSIYVEGLADFRETGREKPAVLMTDAALISLEFAPFSASGNHPKILREYVGPLVTWWREAEDGLKRCWTPSPPVIDGHTLDARLSTTDQ